MEMYDKVPQSQHFSHINHCLDAFRQDIMCNADDTPRFTGFVDEPSSGLGQVRMCKSWTKLESWAKANSACYTYHPKHISGMHISLEAFKSCPDGSQPWV